MYLRKADIKDKDTLVELRMLYIAEDMGPIDPKVEAQVRAQLPDYYERCLNKDLFAYIAEDDFGNAVSCCFLLVCEKPANPRFPSGKTGSALNVYTKAEYRRHGLAGRLLKMLLSDAKQMGLDIIELKATSDGVKLYKSLGFEQDFSKYTDMKLVF